jgi:type IV pilus assembly protein PilB
MITKKRLGEILVGAGAITGEQLQLGLDEQVKGNRRRRIGTVLVGMGAVNEDRVARALAEQLVLPFCDPTGEEVDPEIVWRLPRKLAEQYRIFAFARDGRGVRVAMAEPRDAGAARDVEFALKLPVRVEVASETKILQAIHRHYDLEPQAARMLAEVPASMRAPVTSPTALDLDQKAITGRLDKGGNAFVDLFNFLLVNAIERGASDIHLEPGAEGMRVRYRIDGMLREVLQLPAWANQPLASRIKVVARLDVTDRRKPQDGRALAELGERKVDLRLSIVPGQFGESVVIRLLDSRTLKTDLGSLGWNPKGLQQYFHLVSQPQGMLLVVGPTGSGKTTTLYATINRLRTEHTSIVTVEDPVEHTLQGINQVQVDERAGLTFAAIARSLLRQDPNVLVIGEIRDEESAEAAASAATTGHLVLSTMHTGNAVAAITRLLDLGVPPYLAGHAMLGIVAQRLVRRVCDQCSIVAKPGKEDWERLGIGPVDLGPDVRRAGLGCPACQYAAYSGRLGVFEVLRTDDAIRGLVLQGASERQVWEEARRLGMVTLMEDALDKVRAGLTTIEEVARSVPADPWRSPARSPSPAAPAPEAEEEELVPAPTPDRPVRPRAKVLVVDDAEEIRTLVGATLEDDYDVEFACDGVEALQKVRSSDPDCVVLDVMMPRKSGYEVCKELKEDPATQDLPVIILSARGDTAHIKEGFHVGADDYLPKPFDPEEMELRVRALLRRSGRVRR